MYTYTAISYIPLNPQLYLPRRRDLGSAPAFWTPTAQGVLQHALLVVRPRLPDADVVGS